MIGEESGDGERRRLISRMLALLVAVLLGISLCGCGSASPPPISSSELAAARTFPYYTVYWVGTRFGAYPLTAADGVEGYKPQLGDSLYYGNCLKGKGIFGSEGCTLPLKVTTSIYTLHSNFALGAQRNAVIRGVPAVIYERGRSIELYSGHLAIDVHSDSAKDVLSAASLLRPFNREGSNEQPLPLPLYCPLLYGSERAHLRNVMASLPSNVCATQKAAIERDEALEGKPPPLTAE